MPASFAELLRRLGRDREVADQLGLEREDVKSMRRRDSVAPVHWPALEAAAANAGLSVVELAAVGIDQRDIARLRSGRLFEVLLAFSPLTFQRVFALIQEREGTWA